MKKLKERLNSFKTKSQNKTQQLFYYTNTQNLIQKSLLPKLKIFQHENKTPSWIRNDEKN